MALVDTRDLRLREALIDAGLSDEEILALDSYLPPRLPDEPALRPRESVNAAQLRIREERARQGATVRRSLADLGGEPSPAEIANERAFLAARRRADRAPSLSEIAEMGGKQALGGSLGQFASALSIADPVPELIEAELAGMPPEVRGYAEPIGRGLQGATPEAALARIQQGYDMEAARLRARAQAYGNPFERLVTELGYSGGQAVPVLTEIAGTKGMGGLARAGLQALTMGSMYAVDPETGEIDYKRAGLGAGAGLTLSTAIQAGSRLAALAGGGPLAQLATAAGLGAGAGAGARAAMGESDPYALAGAGAVGAAMAVPYRRAPGQGDLGEMVRAAREGMTRGPGGKPPKPPPEVFDIPKPKNPVGLRGEPPQPDLIPKRRGGRLIIGTFEEMPKNEPPSLLGVPGHAGSNLGRVFETRARPQLATYENEGLPWTQIRVKDHLNGGWKPYVLGVFGDNDEQFLKRVDLIIPDKNEQKRWALWYKKVGSAIARATGTEGEELVKRTIQFGIQNKNTSPADALRMVLTDIEAKSGSPYPRIAGLAGDEAWDAATAGRYGDITYGEDSFKLYDFIDSIFGKKTRTAMNNDPRAGQPTAIDIQAYRERGGIDEKLYSQLLENVHPEDRPILEALKVDKGLSVHQYERGVSEYNALAKKLSKRRHLGIRDWDSGMVHALGWGTQATQSPRTLGGESADTMANLYTHRFAVEVDAPDDVVRAGGAMGQNALNYKNLYDVPDLHREVTQLALENAARAAERIVGLPEGAVVIGRSDPAVWMREEGALSAPGYIRGTEEQAQAAADVMQTILRQREIPLFRPHPRGETIGATILGDQLDNPHLRKFVYYDLSDELVKRGLPPLPDGYTPIGVNEMPGMVALYHGRGSRVEIQDNGKPAWVAGDTLPYRDEVEVLNKLGRRTGRKRPKLEADGEAWVELMKDPKNVAKVNAALRAVGKRRGMKIDLEFGRYDVTWHDETRPEAPSAESHGAVSRLRAAARDAAGDLALRAAGEADARAERLYAAAVEEARRRKYGYGFTLDEVAPNTRLKPALLQYERDVATGDVIRRLDEVIDSPRQPLPMHMQIAEAYGVPARLIDPLRSEARGQRITYSSGFVDRRTRKPLTREEATLAAIAEFGEDAILRYAGVDVARATPELREEVLKSVRGNGLTSEGYKELASQAQRYYRKVKPAAWLAARDEYASAVNQKPVMSEQELAQFRAALPEDVRVAARDATVLKATADPKQREEDPLTQRLHVIAARSGRGEAVELAAPHMAEALKQAVQEEIASGRTVDQIFADHIRLSKVGVSPDQSIDEMRAITRVVADLAAERTREARRGTVTWDETAEEAAKYLGLATKNSVARWKNRPDGAALKNAAELEALGRVMDGYNSEVLRLTSELQQQYDPLKYRQLIDTLHEARALSSSFQGAQAEAGRMLNILRKVREPAAIARNLEGVLDEVAMGKAPEAVLGLLDQAARARQKGQAAKAARIIHELPKPTTVDKIIELAQSTAIGLNPYPYTANVLGNTGIQAWNVAERVLGGLAQDVRETATAGGPRKLTLRRARLAQAEYNKAAALDQEIRDITREIQLAKRGGLHTQKSVSDLAMRLQEVTRARDEALDRGKSLQALAMRPYPEEALDLIRGYIEGFAEVAHAVGEGSLQQAERRLGRPPKQGPQSPAEWRRARIRDELAMKRAGFKGERRGSAFTGPLRYWTQSVFWPLQAMDTFATRMNDAAEMRAKARRIARSEGLTGEAISLRVEELVDEARWSRIEGEPNELARQAERAAEISTLQNKLGPQGSAAMRWVRNIPSPLAVPARLTWLFQKTLVNATAWALQRNPFYSWMFPSTRNALAGRLGREAQADMIGRMMLGTLTVGAILWLREQGKIEGGWNRRQRPGYGALRETTGEQEYSIVTPDGTHIPMRGYDPLSTVVTTTLDVEDAVRRGLLDERDAFTAFGSLVLGIGNTVQNQTFAQGLARMMLAITDESRYGQQFASGFATVFVPSFMGYLDRLRDPYLRKAQTTLEAAKVRAGLSGPAPEDPEAFFRDADVQQQFLFGMAIDAVPPRQDFWGEPIRKQMGYLLRNVSTKRAPDPVASEIKRLIENGALSDVQEPDRKLRDLQKKIPGWDYALMFWRARQRARRDLQRAMLGPNEQLLGSWKSMPDSDKAAQVREAITTYWQIEFDRWLDDARRSGQLSDDEYNTILYGKTVAQELKE